MIDTYVCRKYDKFSVDTYIFYCYHLMENEDQEDFFVGILNANDLVEVFLFEKDIKLMLEKYKNRDELRTSLGCSFIHTNDKLEEPIKIIIPDDVIDMIKILDDFGEFAKMCTFQ